MSLWIGGVGVARGVAIGSAHRLHAAREPSPEIRLAPEAVASEVARFEDALDEARRQLAGIRARIPTETPEEVSAFVDTHLMMMEDRSIADATRQRIRNERMNAEWALSASRDALVQVFDAMDDPYLRTRRDDVEHVCDRLLRILMSGGSSSPEEEPALPDADWIAVAEDISAADLIALAHQGVVGIVTEHGAALSHTAILARSFGLVAVVGAHGALQMLRDGEPLIVDGTQGHVLASPDALALAHFRSRQDHEYSDKLALQKLRRTVAQTRDGQRIRLFANMELPEEIGQVLGCGAEGVGLFRTEFLFMNREAPPDEEEQFQAYVDVLRQVRGTVTIRTLDIGADKPLSTHAVQGAAPSNPALGLRAVRLCLREPALFRTQLRALLRASAHGRLRVLVPMIGSLDEFTQVRTLLAQCRAELQAEGQAMAARVPLGAMIEVPSAAIAAAWLARECRFFSIGTNDLVQYTLAIDRVDEEVSHLFDPLHPAVLRLLAMTIEAGRAAQIPVGLCGEMGGDLRYTPLLIGLGLTELSMHPANLPEIKRRILGLDASALRESAVQLLQVTEPRKYARILSTLTG